MDIKYSVIIPAYNAEKTIKRCIDSLIQSNRNDVELILINDGSTDHTESICMNYAENNKNICFFSKDNGGVSSARNVGLENAKGNYITFVDSDDFVKEDYFEVMDKVLLQDPDFAILGKILYDGTEFVIQSVENYYAESFDIAVGFLSKALRKQILNSPVNKIFKRKLIESHKLRFDERLPIGEDKVLVVQYITNISNLIVANYSIYVVSIENEYSLSRKKREDLCDYILLEHKLLFQAIRRSDISKKNKTKLLDALVYSYYRSAYTVIAELHRMGYSKDRRMKDTRSICKRYNCNREYRIRNYKSMLLAIPIRLYSCRMIDFMLNKKLGTK